MLNALYATPAWLFLILVAGGAVALACTGQVLVHRHFRAVDFVRHNEVGGFMVTVVGTLYAVTLAFVIVIVWQEFDASKERVSIEAADASIVWHTAVGLPAPLDAAMRNDMAEYAKDMIDVEWPLMRMGLGSDRGEDVLTNAIGSMAKFHPKNAGEATVQGTLLSRLSDLHDARRHRFQDNSSGVSWFQWTIIVLGAVVLIGFCYLFGLENTRVHLLMTAAVAFTIASMCVLVVELDYPFRGDLAVSAEPWTTFLERVGHS